MTTTTETTARRYLSPDSTDIIDCLDMTVMALQAASDIHKAINFPGLGKDVFGYTVAKKYARVFYKMGNGQTVVAFFVDVTNGDVWKADGWKKPALNFTRGNIMTKAGRKAISFDKMGESGYFYPAF